MTIMHDVSSEAVANMLFTNENFPNQQSRCSELKTLWPPSYNGATLHQIFAAGKLERAVSAVLGLDLAMTIVVEIKLEILLSPAAQRDQVSVTPLQGHALQDATIEEDARAANVGPSVITLDGGATDRARSPYGRRVLAHLCVPPMLCDIKIGMKITEGPYDGNLNALRVAGDARVTSVNPAVTVLKLARMPQDAFLGGGSAYPDALIILDVESTLAQRLAEDTAAALWFVNWPKDGAAPIEVVLQLDADGESATVSITSVSMATALPDDRMSELASLTLADSLLQRVLHRAESDDESAIRAVSSTWPRCVGGYKSSAAVDYAAVAVIIVDPLGVRDYAYVDAAVEKLEAASHKSLVLTLDDAMSYVSDGGDADTIFFAPSAYPSIIEHMQEGTMQETFYGALDEDNMPVLVPSLEYFALKLDAIPKPIPFCLPLCDAVNLLLQSGTDLSLFFIKGVLVAAEQCADAVPDVPAAAVLDGIRSISILDHSGADATISSKMSTSRFVQSLVCSQLDSGVTRANEFVQTTLTPLRCAPFGKFPLFSGADIAVLLGKTPSGSSTLIFDAKNTLAYSGTDSRSAPCMLRLAAELATRVKFLPSAPFSQLDSSLALALSFNSQKAISRRSSTSSTDVSSRKRLRMFRPWDRQRSTTGHEFFRWKKSELERSLLEALVQLEPDLVMDDENWKTYGIDILKRHFGVNQDLDLDKHMTPDKTTVVENCWRSCYNWLLVANKETDGGTLRMKFCVPPSKACKFSRCSKCKRASAQ